MSTIPHARRRAGRTAAVLGLLGLVTALLSIAGAPQAAAERGEHAATTRAATSVTAGDYHSCALSSTGRVRCWGGNSIGQLGLGPNGVGTPNLGDNESILATAPINLGNGRTATAVVAGGLHTCALLDTRAVKCWGYNSDGQLGANNGGVHLGDNEYIHSTPTVTLGRPATALSAGRNHNCAVLDNGSLRCWGSNAAGQLGLGTTQALGDNEHVASVAPVFLGTGRKVRAVAAGDRHTCAILDNGSLRCWGKNNVGQLGLGHSQDIGDDEPATAAPPVYLGVDRTAVAVSAGGDTTCVVLDNGAVRCWGYNASGAVGSGTPGSLGDDESILSVEPVFLGLGRKASAVYAGGSNSCALITTGNLRCWGNDTYGQLAIAGTNNIGDDEATILPDIPLGPGRTVKSAAVGGGGWICATLDTAETQCWGLNNFGQLGLGSTVPVGDDELPTAYGPAFTAFGARIDPVPTGLTLSSSPKRDRTRPYAFTVKGRITGTHPVYSCAGKVTVRASGKVRLRGTRTVVRTTGSATVAVQKTDAGCSYQMKVTVRASRSRFATRALTGTVRLTARYGGASLLKPSSKYVAVRVG